MNTKLWDNVGPGDIIAKASGPNKDIRLVVIKKECVNGKWFITCKPEDPNTKYKRYYKKDRNEDGTITCTESGVHIVEIKNKKSEKKTRWSHYRTEDLRETKTKKCSKCPYRGGLRQDRNVRRAKDGSELVDDIYCNYLCITGHMRETDIFGCEYYTDNPSEVRKLKKKNNIGSVGLY